MTCIDYYNLSTFDYENLTADQLGELGAVCPVQLWIVSEYQNVIPVAAASRSVVPLVAATKNVIPLGKGYSNVIA